MIEFKHLPFHEIGHVIASNISKHYDEIKEKDSYGMVDADWRGYLELSGQGNCIAFCAYDGDKLAAYSVFVLSQNMNHKKHIDAMNVALYVYPEYRAKVTVKLLKYANDVLLESGVSEIAYMVKDDRIGKILGRAGLEPTHTLWALRNE